MLPRLYVAVVWLYRQTDTRNMQLSLKMQFGLEQKGNSLERELELLIKAEASPPVEK